MNKLSLKKPDYGNWVSQKLIYAPAVIGFAFLGLAFFFSILMIVVVLFLLICAYFAYARYLFSPHGGNIQFRIRELLLEYLDWDGEEQAIDIGCGNAPLTIQLARKYPEAQITGVDYWGESWEYSQGVCEGNAKLEGVGERVTFQRFENAL